MNEKWLILIIFVLLLTNVGVSYGHKAKVLEDYKLDVGWKNEPPMSNEPNAIELVIKLATDYDKQRYDPIFGEKISESNSLPSEKDISGLSKKLEVTIKLGEDKTTLVLVEDPDIPGIYYGEYTPKEVGYANIHVFGTIKNLEFEASFKPEKVQQGQNNPIITQKTIPEWIKNNAGWWADGQIDDNSFVQGIQFLIKEGIISV